MQTNSATFEDEGILPPEAFFAQDKAQEKSAYIPTAMGTQGAFAGSAEGFRRPVATSGDAPGIFSAPQQVNAPSLLCAWLP